MRGARALWRLVSTVLHGVQRLDAAERSTLTELFGLRFRAPPPRATSASAGGRPGCCAPSA